MYYYCKRQCIFLLCFANTIILMFYLLRYLQEIGYTDTILDVRSFRVRSLLGIGPDSTPNNQNLNNGEQQNSSSSSSSAGGGMNKNNLTDNNSKDGGGSGGGEQQSALMSARNFASGAIGGGSKSVSPLKDHDDRDSDSEEEITVLNAKNSSKVQLKRIFLLEAFFTCFPLGRNRLRRRRRRSVGRISVS